MQDTSLCRAGDEDKLLFGLVYPPNCWSSQCCAEPVQLRFSGFAQFGQAAKGESTVVEPTWDMSAVLRPHSCPRALGAAGSSGQLSIQRTQKFNMKEQFPSRSLLLPLSLLSMKFLSCCFSPLPCLRLLLLSQLPQRTAPHRIQSPWGTPGCW